MKPLYRNLLIGFGALVLLLFAGLLLFRAQLLAYVMKEAKTRFEARYPARLKIKSAEFDGLNSVVLTGISVLPNQGPKLLQADSVYAAVSVGKLLLGRVAFNELAIANARFTAVKQDSLDNYSFLYRSRSKVKTTNAKGSTDYGKLFYNLIETAFDKIPDQARFRNLSIDYLRNDRHAVVNMPFLRIQDGKIESQLVFTSDSVTTRMGVNGMVDKDEHRLSGVLFKADTAAVRVPFLYARFGAIMEFDTLRFAMEENSYDNDRMQIKGRASLAGLHLNHEKLALEDVIVRSGSVVYDITIGEKWGTLNKGTVVKVNQMTLHPTARYEKQPDSTKIIRLDVHSDKTPAQAFFNSLPPGIFDNLQGIEASGFLTYKFHLDINTSQLDSLQLDSDLDDENLVITKWGRTDLTKINGPFEHTAWEYGKPARTFMVGPGNPFYTPINQISPYLRNAILTAEDYGFYTHKGFLEEAIRKATVLNIKEKKFLRGGSTISMQLVKNAFLNRNKTLARKVEEALIVWLIENKRLVPKHRMFEVYLNIIEWGPYIYGVRDATRFYFGKNPSELTLAEAIFMTKIIPSPKNFRWLFDSYGRLKPWLRGYFRMIGGTMARRGLITQAEYDNLYPYIYLKGRARQMVVTADSVPPDSLLYPPIPRAIDTTAVPQEEVVEEEPKKKLFGIFNLPGKKDKPKEEAVTGEEKPKKKLFGIFNRKKKKDEDAETGDQ